MKKPINQTNTDPATGAAAAAQIGALSYRDVNFRRLLNHSLSAFILAAPDGNILDANKAACKLFGYQLAAIKQRSWQELACAEDGRLTELLEHWIANGASRGELCGIKKNGERFLFEYSSTVYTDDKGHAFNVTMIQDLSEVKRLHRELSLLMHNTDESFILLDLQLNILSYNSKAARMFQKLMGGPLEKGASVFEYAQPERVQALTAMYARILAGNKETAQVTIPGKDGAGTSFKVKYHPAKDVRGQIIGVFITAKNITKEQAHLNALQQTQETLRKIMDSSLDVICTIDKEGNFVKVSAAAKTVWGYRPEKLLGRPYLNMVVPEDHANTLDVARQIMSGVNLTDFENRYLRKDGSVVIMGWSAHWDDEDELMYCVARDITEKKRSELNLALSEQRFKSLVQDGSDLVGIMDVRGNYTYVSPTSYAILGYYPEALAGKNAFDFIHPEDLERVLVNFAKLADHLKLEVAPFRFRHRNGEWRWIETTVTNLLNEPAVNGYVVNSRDVTERIKAEADIHFSAKLLDTIGQAAIATNLEGTITYWNHAAEMIYGYSREEALGKNIMDITPAPEAASYAGEIMTQLAKGESWAGEFLVKRKNGETFPVWITNSPVLDQEGKLSGIIGVSTDITERKNAEQELEQANERHKLVLKATSDVVWDWNLLTGKVIRSAENMKKLFGYDVQDDINHESFWSSKVHPDEQAEVQAKFDKFLNDPDRYYMECEYRFKTADSSYAYVYDKGFVIRNEAGKPVRMIGSVQDVSYLKRNEIQLKLINNELVQQAKELAFSNKELEQFAYVASHDLQEPLRMVSSFLTQIEKKYEPLLDEKGKRYIHFAVDGAKRMRQIILDLLEYSRAGNKEDQLEEVNPEMIVKEVTALLRRKIEEKQASISVGGLPVVKAHTSPMRQVFQNLVSNALLYSRDGMAPEIHITARDMETDWEFAVKDNGIGIHPAYFEKIFVIFQRLHNKETYAGSGIGLAVTKKIIEHYGGQVWVESTEDKGSSFYFTIPKQPA